MVRLRAELDQFYEIGGRLGSCQIFPDAAERIPQNNFGEAVQTGLPASGYWDFCLEKQVQLTGERTLRPPRAFGCGLDAT